MDSMFWGLFGLFAAFVVLLAVVAVLRRRVGGGFGPTERSDGSMTVSPTGYSEKHEGHGKTIGPTDNNAAKY